MRANKKTRWRKSQLKSLLNKLIDKGNQKLNKNWENHADYQAGKVSLRQSEQVDPGLTSSVNLTELQSLISSSCRIKELNISSAQYTICYWKWSIYNVNYRVNFP